MGKDGFNKLVVANVGWADTIPDWLKKEIETERLIEGFANAATLTKPNGGSPRASLAETCAYLYTASLTGPLGHYYTRIYLWVTSKVIEKAKGVVPDFIKETLNEELNDYEKRLLDELRVDIARKRGEVRHPLFDALKALGKEIKKGSGRNVH